MALLQYSPIVGMFFCYFFAFFQHFMTEIDGKSCFSIKKISTSEWRAGHPFAGQNTQLII